MINRNYILYIFICLIFYTCKNKQKDVSDFSIKNQTNEIVSRKVLKTYFSTIDIPYLLKEEIDSILVNEDRVKNDKNYRNKFISKARGRSSGIRKLRYSYYNNKSIPFPFKVYLLPDEYSNFNKDSITSFVILYELYKKRVDTIKSITNYLLTQDEIQSLIQSSFKDSVYYKELSTNRFKKDSIKSAIKFNKRKDSLQKIIYPIDSILPFGPKFLGKLVRNKTNYFGFQVKRRDSLSKEQKNKKKDVDDAWQYFSKFFPNEDLDDLYYPKNLLPSIKTYEIIKLGFDPLNYNQIFNPKYASFKTRISDIGGYEVYFTTVEGKGLGFLLFYNREKQHSIAIPVLSFNDPTRFFYIKNNTIYIYDYASYNQDYSPNKKPDILEINKTHEIKILNNGNIVINEQCIREINFEKEKLTEDEIKRKNEIEQKSKILFKKKRDSLQDYIKPLVTKYPFGPKVVKKYQFPSKEYYIKNDRNNTYKNALDSIFKYYRYIYDTPINSDILFHNHYTLPTVRKINKINIGIINFWPQGIFEKLQQTAYCENTKDIENYKLPPIKNYEVYYSSYNSRGVLILYNKITKNAHVINVLNIDNYYFRFFYINKEEQIEIYQGFKNDIPTEFEKNNTYKITKTHIIEILSNGEIKVIQQK